MWCAATGGCRTNTHTLGKGDRHKWHGHRAREQGGAGALANIMEHAGSRRGKPPVSLLVVTGPGAWVRPSISTGCGLTLALEH